MAVLYLGYWNNYGIWIPVCDADENRIRDYLERMQLL